MVVSRANGYEAARVEVMLVTGQAVAMIQVELQEVNRWSLPSLMLNGGRRVETGG